MTTQLSELRRQLVGRKIRAVISISAKTQREAFCWSGHEPAFAFLLDDGSYVAVLRDPEGNGPGFLDVTEPQQTIPTQIVNQLARDLPAT